MSARALTAAKVAAVTVGMVVAGLVPAAPLAADPGDLDTSFSRVGAVRTDVYPDTDRLVDVAPHPDGGYAAVGYSTSGAEEAVLVARLTDAGDPDTLFRGSGYVTMDLTPTLDRGYAVAVQPDGKMLVAGLTTAGRDRHFAILVMRVTANGFLDSSFGDGDGFVSTSVGALHALANDIIYDASSETITVAGYYHPESTPNTTRMLVARYTSEGDLDESFDNNGLVDIGFGADVDAVANSLVPTFGAVTVAGYVKVPLGGENVDYNVALARLTPSGSPDTNFSGDGKLTTSISGSAHRDVADEIVAAGSKYLVVGSAGPVQGAADFLALRYTLSGSLDTTFSGDGKLVVPFTVGSDDRAWGAVQAASGDILMVGSTKTTGTDSSTAAVMLNSDGTIDASFGGGKVVTDLSPGGSDVFQAVRRGPEAGSYLAVGQIEDGAQDGFRLNGAAMTIEATGEVQSRATLDAWRSIDEGRDVAIQADGKVVVVGSSRRSSEWGDDVAVVRYGDDGTLDQTFGQGDGILIDQSPSSQQSRDEAARSVELHPDTGAIWFGGTAEDEAGQNDFMVGRVRVGGTGMDVFTADLGGHDEVLDVAIDPVNETIIAAGHTTGGRTSDSALFRWGTDGQVDETFGGGDGFVVTPIGSQIDGLTAVEVLADHTILVGGRANFPIGIRPFVAKGTVDGTLDPSFGDEGVQAVDISAGAYLDAMELTPAGKIVIGGRMSHNSYVARLTPEGELDTTFNGTGIAPLDVSAGNDEVRDLALASDGKVAVTGAAETNDDYDIFALRVRPNGTIDPTFGPGTDGEGIVLYGASNLRENGNAIAVAPETGKIVVTGSRGSSLNPDPVRDFLTVRWFGDPYGISIRNASVVEGNAGTSTVSVRIDLHTPSASVVTVEYATDDREATAPSDYTEKSGTITFQPGQTRKMVKIVIRGDTAVEFNERFDVVLSAPNGAPIGDELGLVTIENDD